ncbi:MAG: LysM peptidoglycan-binding domain-containing protein, partial [Candidatus Margulisiibacteriota bacterium]
LLPMLCVAVTPAGSAILYKSFLVKYDRGWDILCDPYVVQNNDWVYKIFRQKGELSAKDFREFINIFKRLNPHIHNIDRIRPNQNIIIPLKKIEPGTFPNQSSGVVSIPFVTISKLSDLLVSYANTYEVRKGNTISELIADRFGTYGTQSYHEGIQLFKTINPQVDDINFIFIGQQLKLPDVVLRNQAWYQSLFDKAGQIKKELMGTSRSASILTPAATSHIVKSPGDPISETAAVLDGKLLNRGTYFFPRKGKEDFELDLSRFPVIELKNGSRIVFANNTDASKTDLSLLRSLWENVTILEIEKDTPVDTILEAVLQDTVKEITQTEISFSDNGMDVVVTAKWIKPSLPGEDGATRHTCISLIEDKAQKTSDAIVRYLDQHHVAIKDILESEAGIDEPESSTASSTPFVLPDVVTLTPIYRKTFVRDLVEAMGNQYSRDITVTFPYAGIQVQAVSNLVSTGSGREFLIDFGDLYGDAVTEIQKTGLNVVQIRQDDSMNTLITRILDAIGEPYVSDPVFYAAKRPADFNTKIKIKGFLITKTKGSRVLISAIPLHNRVLQFFNEDDVKVVLAGLLE